MKISNLIEGMNRIVTGLALLLFSGLVIAQTPRLVPQPQFYQNSYDGLTIPLICTEFHFSDLNNDRLDDLIVTRGGGRSFPRPPNVAFFFTTQVTNADGTSGPLIQRDAGIFGCGFTSGKMLPGSTNKDLVIFQASTTQAAGASPPPRGIGILPGNGDGTFGAPIIVSGPVGQPIGVMDVSGAGYARDLLAMENGVAKIYSRNQLDGAYSLTAFFELSVTGTPVVADLNSDGRSDLVVDTKDGNGNSVQQLYLGGGTIDNPSMTLINTTAMGLRSFKVSADFNGDGKPDFLLTDTTSGTAVQNIVLNDGMGKPGQISVVVPRLPASVIPIAPPRNTLFTDMDGDGFADMVTDNQTLGTYQIFFFKGAGDGTFAPPVSISEAPWARDAVSDGLLSAIATGANGKKSVVVAEKDSSSFQNIYYVFLNTADVLANTSTSLEVSATAPTVGQPLSFTASVSGNAPSGIVNFYRFVTFPAGFSSVGQFGSAPLVNGKATLTLPAGFAVGTYRIEAAYYGDPGNKVSSSATSLLEVTQAISQTITLLTVPPTATSGQAINLSAAVSGDQPTGSIIFYDGSTSLGSASMVNGQATLNLPSGLYAAGTHTITATYSGDVRNGSSSASSNITVGKMATQSSLSTLTEAVESNMPVVLTAKITGNNPTGTFIFSAEDGSEIGRATLINGVATLSIVLPKGKYAIKANYLGDVANLPSTSNTVEIKVKKFNERKAKFLDESRSLAEKASEIVSASRNIFNNWTSYLRKIFGTPSNFIR